MLKNDMFYNMEHSGKSELDSYLPKYWGNILEMEANNTFAGYTLDRMAEDMEQLVKDRFFGSCSEMMLSRYEKFLHIAQTKGVSIEDRRSLVIMKWSGGGKMTGSRIKEIVKDYCGADCEVTFGKSQLVIDMTFRDNPAIYMPMIREIISNSTIPSHIEIVFKGNVELEIVFEWKNEMDVSKLDLMMEFSMYHAPGYFDGSLIWDGTHKFGSSYPWFDTGNIFPVQCELKEEYEESSINNITYVEQREEFDCAVTIKRI